MRTDILDKKDQILQWIAEERPKAFISNQLNCKQQTLNKYLNLMGIQYEGQQNKKGQQKGNNKYKSAWVYIETGVPISSARLKEKLLFEGIKQKQCERCGLNEWLGQPIPLELHHKDGNHYNNSFNNLEILCPNCHAMEPVVTSNHTVE